MDARELPQRLNALWELHNDGLLTDAEFSAAKAAELAPQATSAPEPGTVPDAAPARHAPPAPERPSSLPYVVVVMIAVVVVLVAVVASVTDTGPTASSPGPPTAVPSTVAGQDISGTVPYAGSSSWGYQYFDGGRVLTPLPRAARCSTLPTRPTHRTARTARCGPVTSCTG